MKQYKTIREETNQKIGKYLRKLIDSKYRKRNDFYRDYLKHEGIEPNAEEVRKMGNRFSQIFIGEKKGLQIHDLLIITDLLGISCEELLTCGKAYRPISGHMTNYEIAFSNDKRVWQEYIMSEDKLFLNSDEYGKTVVDYALEFKNYPFIHWLIDERYIYFEQEQWLDKVLFLAKTKMKRRDIHFTDSDFPPQVYEEEQFRMKLVALAIENGDFKIMESMKVREASILYGMSSNINNIDDCLIHDERIIEAIVCSDDETIYDYFSEEFQITTKSKCIGQYLYSNLGSLIDYMLQDDTSYNNKVEKMIKRVVEHNKKSYEAISIKAEEYYQSLIKDLKEVNKEFALHFREETMMYYKFDRNSNVVSFMDTSEDGVRTNAICIFEASEELTIKKLIEEANDWYEKLLNFKRDFTQKYI